MARNQTDSSATTGYEAELWAMADTLRRSMDAAEYKHVVLGLIFLKVTMHMSKGSLRDGGVSRNGGGSDRDSATGSRPGTMTSVLRGLTTTAGHIELSRLLPHRQPHDSVVR